jgi:hypothetical protein
MRILKHLDCPSQAQVGGAQLVSRKLILIDGFLSGLKMPAVLCKIQNKAGGREEFRENRKQLRCCNWIQLSNVPIIGQPVVKGERRQARSQNIRPTQLSFVPPYCADGSIKLLRKKRRMRDQFRSRHAPHRAVRPGSGLSNH